MRRRIPAKGYFHNSNPQPISNHHKYLRNPFLSACVRKHNTVQQPKITECLAHAPDRCSYTGAYEIFQELTLYKEFIRSDSYEKAYNEYMAGVSIVRRPISINCFAFQGYIEKKKLLLRVFFAKQLMRSQRQNLPTITINPSEILNYELNAIFPFFFS